MDPTPAASSTPEQRSTEFRAVQGGKEMQSGAALLTEAYAAIWLCALALVLLGLVRVRRLESRLDQLAADVARARAKGEAPRAKASETTDA